MKLLALSIDGFRGIQHSNIRFNDHTVIIGANGSGKSTIIDALSLVFGRTRLVRDLTEHDFHGSCPQATSRIRIVATLGGFSGNDPDRHGAWFREGRAVPKWWNPRDGEARTEPGSAGDKLCAQLGFAARFDLEDLGVDQIRYFHDDDVITDPFQEEAIQQIPNRLLDDIGYYVLPVRRTWEAATSFTSELFRKAVTKVGGIPAQTVLAERDRLRQPRPPLESDAGLLPLVQRVNEQLGQLLPRSPQFQLRVTSTDSDSLLRGLVPHYQIGDSVALPVGRHGTGLLSLQTFILLLEIGRERLHQGRPFILAMEEPELHVPPGLQRQLVAQAASVATQTICTSHSPQVAAFYPATSVQILEQRAEELVATPMLAHPLGREASNAERKLYHDDRPRVVEAMMHTCVLVPEGRSDYEWFRVLSDALETADRAWTVPRPQVPPFGSVVGVVPTHESAVINTYERLRRTRAGLVPFVDGDDEGNTKVDQLGATNPRPEIILQWPDGWSVEDAIGWILKSGEATVVADLQERLESEFSDIDELVGLFKVQKGQRRFKTDYLAYQEVGTVIKSHDTCLDRAERILTAITLTLLGRHQECTDIQRDEGRSSERCSVLRFST